MLDCSNLKYVLLLIILPCAACKHTDWSLTISYENRAYEMEYGAAEISFSISETKKIEL